MRRNRVNMAKVFRLCFMAALLALSLSPVGCGHTDEEMAQKQREIDKLSADLKTAQQQLADDQAKYTDAQSQIEQMKQQLREAGLSVDKSKEEASRLQQALAEYKQRSDQLAAIEQRFRE